MSPYNPEDYQVMSTYTSGMFKEDILNGATISIRGAIFQIERVYTRNGKPTRIFEFTKRSAFVDNDTSKELIELGWNYAPAGLIKIGRELGLEYKLGASAFSLSGLQPHFVEVKA